MKKLLSIMVVSLMLLAGCVTSGPVQRKVEPPKEKYKIEFVNDTNYYLFAVMCVAPAPIVPESKSLIKPFGVYPEHINSKYGDVAPHRVTILLEEGTYEAFIIIVDLRTKEQLHQRLGFVVKGDGQMTFKEKETRANTGATDV
jgi:hypothetical protein